MIYFILIYIIIIDIMILIFHVNCNILCKLFVHGQSALQPSGKYGEKINMYGKGPEYLACRAPCAVKLDLCSARISAICAFVCLLFARALWRWIYNIQYLYNIYI